MTHTKFIVSLILIICASVAFAFILGGCTDAEAPEVPTVARPLAQGWACSSDLVPSSRITLYLVVAPDGQRFLVSSGGIIPYIPKTIPAPAQVEGLP